MQRDYSSFPPIGIIAYSDFYETPVKRVWGDYWFKENLTREFLKFGYPVNNSDPGIILHLFGEPLEKMPSGAYNMLWIHSHPDWITPQLLNKYQKIYCISKYFIRKIAKMGFEAELLMSPTNMTPLKMEKKYDIVFVGNTKQAAIRKVIRDIGRPPYDIKIWGWGWKGLIPDDWYGGEYFENERLNELYASSKIVLNDHHEDMQREGFINPRILDILASGGFVISDRVLGLGELLNDNIPVYDTPEELRIMINKYMNDDAGRDLLAEGGRDMALKYTYAVSCMEIIKHIESVSGKFLS